MVARRYGAWVLVRRGRRGLAVTSIERTAYPQFKRLTTARVLHVFFTPAEAAIREAALVRNHPPDLINVALERLVEASLELPAFSTLNEMATSIRAEVTAGIFAGIVSRMGPDGRQRAQGLLATAGPDGRS